MKTQELKLRINTQLSDINAKILQLKNQYQRNKMDRELLELIADLESLRVDIMHQYNLLNSMNSDEEEQLLRIENTVFQSARTFDTAFKKAGTTMSTSRIRNRERSVDFNNPTGTR